ncbi:hypothetical protein D3C74_85660 [compost metagenome]
MTEKKTRTMIQVKVFTNSFRSESECFHLNRSTPNLPTFLSTLSVYLFFYLFRDDGNEPAHETRQFASRSRLSIRSSLSARK